MAVRTLRTVVRNPELRVVESGSEPARGGVTRCTGRRESHGRVIWIRGRVVICFVASVAVGWQRGVVVVHMAAGAGNRSVESGKRKCR